MNGEEKIPKVIHYCWFGKGNKSKIFDKCIESWRKYLPDYKIVEWNEENFDIECNCYVKEAYEKRKYAFVSDYARLKILYENGGIYFDTDVEVIKHIKPEILEKGYFAKEVDNELQTGLGFCVPPKNQIIKYMMDDYEDIHFIKEKQLDLTPCPKRNTESLIKRGYTIDASTEEIEGIKVYDKNYFCGFDLITHQHIISDKTYTIHHYEASWAPKSSKIKAKIKGIISNIIGRNVYQKIRKIKLHLKNKIN